MIVFEMMCLNMEQNLVKLKFLRLNKGYFQKYDEIQVKPAKFMLKLETARE